MIDLNGWALRDEYQKPAHDATINYCKNYKGAAYNNMTVGAGKSLMIAALAKHTVSKGGKVLVISRQGEIVEQNVDEAWSVGLSCSIFSASLDQKSTFYPCVMGTEQTISNHLKDEFTRFIPDLILIDECHHVPIDDVNKLIKNSKSKVESSYAKIIKHFLNLNPKVRIIGYTGTPFRGVTDIMGDFWVEEISTISTAQLIQLGYLVPPVFGFGDVQHHYDLSEFKKTDEKQDYTQSELLAMERKITKSKGITKIIIEEVVERTKNRNGVLITCAGKDHCKQVLSLLPESTSCIITEETPKKERKELIGKIKSGQIKYVIQVGCLTTGFNAPLIDTCVIMRKIGSLTLLVQLIGRALRTLKKAHIDSGVVKDDALILDYTDTIECLGDFFDDPILNKAKLDKPKQDGETQTCPLCAFENSIHAVRCINGSLTDSRCEYFFKFQECKSCGTHNAPTARNCRKCNAILIDPNKALTGKAYTDADYKLVRSAIFTKTLSGDGLCVTYALESEYMDKGIKKPEFAKEYYKPFSKEPHDVARWRKFLSDHMHKSMMPRLRMFRSIDDFIKNKAVFDIPIEITHRVNSKGFSIINRKRFRSGREELS